MPTTDGTADPALVPAHVRRQPLAGRRRPGRPAATCAAACASTPPTASAPPTIDYLAEVARTAEQLGFTGVLTPTGTWCEDAWLMTAALLRETTTAEVPGRVPARGHQPGARGADGGGVPADLRRPADAQRRHRRRAHRAGAVRRHRPQGRALRPHRRVPDVVRGTWDAGAVRLRRRALPRRGRDGQRRHRPGAARSTSAGRPSRPGRSRPRTPTST